MDQQRGRAGIGGCPVAVSVRHRANDDDFISIAKGGLWVRESGTYTIQVRSDEGMGLRMIGARSAPYTDAAHSIAMAR